MTVTFLGIKPFQMLYYSAVINGIIAPFLMAMIMLVGNNKRVMGEHVNGRLVGLMGWAITAIMGCCAAALGAALIAGRCDLIRLATPDVYARQAIRSSWLPGGR